MLKFGIISKIDGDKGLVQVKFPDDDDMISGWLPMLQHGSKANKYFRIPDLEEHVSCLMDENCENGVVLGSIYSKDETPGAAKGKDIAGVEFSDGTVVKYDRAGHKLIITTTGNVEIEAATMKLTGDLDVTGKITASEGITAGGDLEATGDIKTTNGDIKTTTGDVKAALITLKLHKHGGVTSGGSVTATPVP